MSSVTVTRGEVGGEVGDRGRTFDDFYARERPGLYRALSFALGDPGLAAEAVDEGMARGYQRWRRISGYDNPAGWVYRVSLNWARSALRKRRVERSDVVPERGRRDPDLPDPELWEAVGALTTPLRDVVVLRFVLDWSLEQIAAALDVPVGTVKSRQHRALATMREQLEVTR